MQLIDSIERHLPDKRRALLRSLRTHNWHVVGIDDSDADWARDSKWLIESTREEKGFQLWLWFYKAAGIYDGVDRVVATNLVSPEPGPYGEGLSIEFDSKHFEKQLQSFMTTLNMLRFESRTDETRIAKD